MGIRMHCWYCHKFVSNELPDDSVFRCISVCPECLATSDEGRNHPLKPVAEKKEREYSATDISSKSCSLMKLFGGTMHETAGDRLLDFFNARTPAEKLTFVWEANRFDRNELLAMRDADGRAFVNINRNIDWLLKRPIFYVDRIQKGWILFGRYI